MDAQLDGNRVRFNDGKLEIQLKTPTPPEVMLQNMAHNLARGLKQLPLCKPHDHVLSIAAGGPSLADTYTEMEGHVAAGNGSLGYLIDRGLVPHFCNVLDALPHMAEIVVADPRVNYLIASNCDPRLFDKLLDAGCKVWIWNPTPDNLGIDLTDDAPFRIDPQGRGFHLLGQHFPDQYMIGGGTSVGLRMMFLGYTMGYRTFHLHGNDASFKDRETHAYWDRRWGEWVDHSSIEICGYRTSLNFLQHVTSFAGILANMVPPRFDRITMKVYGDGLIQSSYRYWLKHMSELNPGEAFQSNDGSVAYAGPVWHKTGQPTSGELAPFRAQAILDRLPDGPVKGAEIGVFSGLMSRVLLRRADLELIMIDSWEGNGAAYSVPGTDWHATLSAEEQQDYMMRAHHSTQFALDRRQVIRARSLNAAEMVADGSLDFVFLDADHSYWGAAADIEAWLPKLKPGGLLCGHDYDHQDFPGVKTAVDNLAANINQSPSLDIDRTWFITKPMEMSDDCCR